MYKTIKLFALPPALIFFLLTLLVIMMWWKRAASRRWLICLTMIVVLFYAGSTRLVTRLLIGSLEWSYPRQQSTPDQADAILVLGGGTRYYGTDDPLPYMPSESSMNRILHAAQVYHKVGGCPIIVSGNDHQIRNEPNSPLPEDPLTFNSMSRLLLDLGVKRDDILLEKESRDTYENVRFAKKLIEQQGFKNVALVTDAAHMRRSELCCKKLGLKVIPAPCNYYAQAFEFRQEIFIPSSMGTLQARNATREYIGLFWYWLQGRI